MKRFEILMAVLVGVYLMVLGLIYALGGLKPDEIAEVSAVFVLSGVSVMLLAFLLTELPHLWAALLARKNELNDK